MPQQDNLAAAALGALEGFNSAFQPYMQMRFQRQLKQQELGDELSSYKQKLPLEEASKIRESQATSGFQLAKQSELEQQKDTMLGSQFSPYAQKTLNLDPAKQYRLSEVEKSLGTKEADLRNQSLMGSHQAIATQSNDTRQNIADQNRGLLPRIMNAVGFGGGGGGSPSQPTLPPPTPQVQGLQQPQLTDAQRKKMAQLGVQNF